jgi:hypothetical protein
LAPDNPHSPALQKASKDNGGTVVHHLGLAIDKALHADFRQGSDPLGGNLVAVLSWASPLAGALRTVKERRVPAHLTDHLQTLIQGIGDQGAAHIPAIHQQDGLESVKQGSNDAQQGFCGHQLARVPSLTGQAREDRDAKRSESL